MQFKNDGTYKYNFRLATEKTFQLLHRAEHFIDRKLVFELKKRNEYYLAHVGAVALMMAKRKLYGRLLHFLAVDSEVIVELPIDLVLIIN